MNVLLLYPKTKNAQFNKLSNYFWRFRKNKNTLPKELLEIAIELPITWNKKFVDLNRKKLGKKEILWSDYVIVKAGRNQSGSALHVLEKCKLYKKRVVVKGELYDMVRSGCRFSPGMKLAQFINKQYNSILDKCRDTKILKTRNTRHLTFSLFEFSPNL